MNYVNYSESYDWIEYKSRLYIIHVFSFVFKTSGKAFPILFEKKKINNTKMTKFLFSFSLSLLLLSVVNAQRGSYAGVRPISNGIKGPFPDASTGLSNRFGDDNSLNNNINGNPNNQRPLPVDALGNVHLVNTLVERPWYQQPFWLLNYQQIEAHRNQPQLSLGGPLANRGSFQGRR